MEFSDLGSLDLGLDAARLCCSAEHVAFVRYFVTQDL